MNKQLVDLIEASSVIVPFTGAGISTECGIPDFRSPGGIWSHNQPIEYDQFVTSSDARAEAWRRRYAMEPIFAQANPGRGHLALAALYRAGKVPKIITQNIDNLHQMSGIPDVDVIELHGNTTYARCIGCGAGYDIDSLRPAFEASGEPPECTVCMCPIKPATISFGQQLPDDAMQAAAQYSQQCDLFIVIGSSLVVWPAASFPLMAKSNNARLVIINNEPTDQDDIADLVVRGDIGDALSWL